MIEAFAVLNNDDDIVYKVGDDFFSSIEAIFNDEDARYLILDAVQKHNLLQEAHNAALDFLYPKDIDFYEVKSAFDEYLESLGNDVLEVSYENGTWCYILDKSEEQIIDTILDILKKQIEE